MIVPCAQCHTRFKVPDGKVTARGRKVRCSRCGHTFRVFPESASDAHTHAAAHAAGPDPFEAFGPPGVSDMEKTPARGTEVSALLAQMGPAPTAEDFDVDVAGEEPPGTEPAWNFPPAPGAAPAAQSSGAAALAVPPLAEVPVQQPILVRPQPVPRPEVSDSSGGGASLAEVHARAPIPVRPLPPAEPEPAASPVGAEPSGGSASPPPAVAAPGPAPALPPDLAALAGFTPAWGLAAPVRALAMDGTISSHPSRLDLGVEPEPAPAPASPPSGGTGIVLDDLPTLEQLGPETSGWLELDPGHDTRDWTGAPTAHGGLQLELAPDLGSLELDRSPPPGPEQSPDRAWSLAPAPGARAPAPGAPSALSWDDPFQAPPPAMSTAPLPASPPPALTSLPALAADPEPASPPQASASSSVVLDEAPAPNIGEADHGFFEMRAERPSPAPVPTGELLPDIPDLEEPLPPASLSSPGLRTPISAISKPPARARLGLQEREEPGTARQVSAVILNVGLAALLLVVVAGLASSWMSAGRLDGSALSPRRWLEVLRPPHGVTPIEITPGTYETRSGRSLLYVRGRVLNRGAPSTRIRVRAEVWDGARAVKSGETLAGAIASPEELWRAATPADVEALRTKLLATAAPVSDGQQADFLVLLDDAPGDLSGLRLRVTASIERQGAPRSTTAAAPDP